MLTVSINFFLFGLYEGEKDINKKTTKFEHILEIINVILKRKFKNTQFKHWLYLFTSMAVG